MQMHIVSLFPDMVKNVARYGVVGRACQDGLLSVATTNPRDFAEDVHRTVDDRPYGGGPGMILSFGPLSRAIAAAKEGASEDAPVVLLTPQGKRFEQADAERFAALDGLVLVAGRYEGVDERITDALVEEELSLGDFVLSGGEIAAMAVVDAVARLLPGVLGDADSAEQDSFADGLLDCPHYTRPSRVAGRDVPDVLLSGDHGQISRWRLKEALGRTGERRPDLLERRGLSDEEQHLLEEYVRERQ